QSPDGPDDRLVAAGLGVAALGPIVVASLLVLVREHLASSNAALVFVVVVVLAAAVGGRWTGVVAAVVSAMSYDFFLTRPYGSIDIPRRRFMHGEFTLPEEGVELPVLGRGRLLGRLVLEPEPDVGVSIEERVVAIALSDQLGVALAAELDAPKPNGEHENDPF